jgi:hypothetical protein
VSKLQPAVPGYPPSGAGGPEAQMARARALGFRLAQTQICLKKLVDPGHKHSGGGLSRHGCPFQLRLDHPRLWRSATGELFATAEPHQLDLEGLAWLLTASRDLGLAVTLDGRSMYDPGHTFTVLITRQGSEVSLEKLGAGSVA